MKYHKFNISIMFHIQPGIHHNIGWGDKNLEEGHGVGAPAKREFGLLRWRSGNKSERRRRPWTLWACNWHFQRRLLVCGVKGMGVGTRECWKDFGLEEIWLVETREHWRRLQCHSVLFCSHHFIYLFINNYKFKLTLKGEDTSWSVHSTSIAFGLLNPMSISWMIDLTIWMACL